MQHIPHPSAMDERSQAFAQAVDLGQSTPQVTTTASHDDNILQAPMEIGSVVPLLLLFWIHFEFR